MLLPFDGEIKMYIITNKHACVLFICITDGAGDESDRLDVIVPTTVCAFVAAVVAVASVSIITRRRIKRR